MSTDYNIKCFKCGVKTGGDNLRYHDLPLLFAVCRFAKEFSGSIGGYLLAGVLEAHPSAGFFQNSDSVAELEFLGVHGGHDHDLGVIDEYGNRQVDEYGDEFVVKKRYEDRVAKLRWELEQTERDYQRWKEKKT